jgi:RNA polymerase sigma-70 factor (ECF subfamily)
MNLSMCEENGALIGDITRESSDELLVSAAKSGDSRAFVELCERHSKKVLPTIFRITKNREDAEDVLQDAFLKAFVHLKSFEGRASFSSWLTRIAINSALMVLRKKRRLEIPIDYAWDDPQARETWEPWDHSGTPESHYVEREKEELLRDAIVRLPSNFREVVELRHAQEYSTKEIAQLLGISLAAAKSRLTRARVAVRATISARPLRSVAQRELAATKT